MSLEHGTAEHLWLVCDCLLTQVAEERLSNMRTVRAFVQEEREQNAYNQQIDQVLKLSYKEALARGIFWGTVRHPTPCISLWAFNIILISAV